MSEGEIEDPPRRRGPERGPADDLAEGLGLILRAARRAVGQIDPKRIEELGRQAARRIEQIDRDKLGEMTRQAVKSFDATKVESLAQDAGRELVNVADRLASRIEEFVSDVERRSSEADRDERGRDEATPQRRMRVDDEK